MNVDIVRLLYLMAAILVPFKSVSNILHYAIKCGRVTMIVNLRPFLLIMTDTVDRIKYNKENNLHWLL